MDASELEEDVPNEVLLRLLSRVRQGFDGECQQFRSYLYRVVTSVTADSVRRNLDRRALASLDSPFETADGTLSTLRDFVDNSSRLGKMAEYDRTPEEASLGDERSRELASAVCRLDSWCGLLIREAVIGARPHAAIAMEHGVSVQMLDVSLKRCTERLYRSLLATYASGSNLKRRREIAEAAKALPEDLRAVFVPWWTGSLSVRQIASDLGLSQDTARRRLAKAKATMWAIVGN